eukprot:jgi/Antlo1/1039/2482
MDHEKGIGDSLEHQCCLHSRRPDRPTPSIQQATKPTNKAHAQRYSMGIAASAWSGRDRTWLGSRGLRESQKRCEVPQAWRFWLKQTDCRLSMQNVMTIETIKTHRFGAQY